jgi:hypothetical protein
VVPANFVSATVQINCTPFVGLANPFSNPNMAITFGVHWSWDGGTTFPLTTQGTQQGSPSGSWGKDRAGIDVMVPNVTVGLPSSAPLGGTPTRYRAYVQVVGGPITFGATVLETVV